MLNIEKAQSLLGWKPTLNANEAINLTVDWYQHFYAKNVDMYDFTIEQINEFESKINF